MGFVVPAGGLGERLGFTGVKFALPVDSCSGATVLQVYVEYMLAIQRHAEEREQRKVRRGQGGKGGRGKNASNRSQISANMCALVHPCSTSPHAPRTPHPPSTASCPTRYVCRWRSWSPQTPRAASANCLSRTTTMAWMRGR